MEIYNGQKVIGIGYPSGYGNHMMQSEGMLISYAYQEDVCEEQYKIGYQLVDCNKAQLVVAVELYPGNSGGPLLTQDGKVISLLSVVNTDEPLAFYPVLLDNQEFLARWESVKQV